MRVLAMPRTDCILTPKKPINGRLLSAPWLGGRVLVACLLATGTAHAELTDMQPLLLEDAIQWTLQKHPELASFAHRRDALQGQVQQAQIRRRPELDVDLQDGLGTGRRTGFGQVQSTLSISWILEGELVAASVEAAQVKIAQVDGERTIRALNVAAETAALFVQDLARQARIELARQSVEQAEDALSVARRREAAGSGATMEVLQAQAELQARQLEVDVLTHELEAGRYQLAAQWGGDRIYRPDGDLHLLPSVGDLDQQRSLLKNSPLLHPYVTRQRIAESEMMLARIEAKPRWQFSTGLRRYEDADDFALVAGLSIPLGKDRRSTGRLRTLRGQQAQDAAEADALERRMDSQLYELLLELEHGLHVIEALTDGILPTLEEAHRQARQAYEIGQLSYLQWHDLRRQWLAARHNLIATYEATHLRHIELQRLVGASLTQ